MRRIWQCDRDGDRYHLYGGWLYIQTGDGEGRDSMNRIIKRRTLTVLKTLVAAVLLVIQVYPIFYVVTSSMKTTDDFRHLASYALPSAFNLENYVKVFTTSSMLTYFKNSIIITVGVLIPLLIISFMAGVALSKIHFKGNKRVLEFLMLAPGRVFSREQLLDGVWGHDVYIDERTVDVHVGRLRKALNGPRQADPIRTVRGSGYAFDETFSLEA